jgi:hypothetical protein
VCVVDAGMGKAPLIEGVGPGGQGGRVGEAGFAAQRGQGVPGRAATAAALGDLVVLPGPGQLLGLTRRQVNHLHLWFVRFFRLVDLARRAPAPQHHTAHSKSLFAIGHKHRFFVMPYWHDAHSMVYGRIMCI